MITDFAKKGMGLAKLGTELKEKIFDAVDDFPFGLEKTKEVRLKLIKEWSFYVTHHKRAFEQTESSLCEH